jgi:hypothetical protein
MKWDKSRQVFGLNNPQKRTLCKGPGKEAIRSQKPAVLLGVRELGISGASLAERFEMSQPGVVYAVKKGQKIAKERGWRLLEWHTDLQMDVPVHAASTGLLEASRLRAMGALHAASAMVWGAELFVSSDKRQISAAKKAGLKTKSV